LWLGCGAAGLVLFGIIMTFLGGLVALVGVLLLTLSFPLTYIGLTTAIAVWWEVRNNPYLYSRSSVRQAKVGLFLCLVPVFLTVLAVALGLLDF
jgi:hypothetical protein